MAPAEYQDAVIRRVLAQGSSHPFLIDMLQLHVISIFSVLQHDKSNPLQDACSALQHNNSAVLQEGVMGLRAKSYPPVCDLIWSES